MLRVAGWKRPSVTPYVTGLVGSACRVVAQARIPGARLGVSNGDAALQVDPVNGPAFVPGIPVPVGIVARSFTTIEFGTTAVSVF